MRILGCRFHSHFWRLLQTLVAILDFQFACVTSLHGTMRLATFYCNCNDSPNVIIGNLKVNLLVNRNTKGSVQIIMSVQIVAVLEVLYLEKLFAYL
jgi:hypothetical protein